MGKIFTGWEVAQPEGLVLAPDSENPLKATFTMPAKNVKVTAKYEQEQQAFNVTITNGTASPGNPVNVGELVTINAAASAGSFFGKWDINPSDIKFMDTNERSQTAKFYMPAQNVTANGTYYTIASHVLGTATVGGKSVTTTKVNGLTWTCENILDDTWDACKYSADHFADWRMPSNDDWSNLFRAMGGTAYSNTHLISDKLNSCGFSAKSSERYWSSSPSFSLIYTFIGFDYASAYFGSSTGGKNKLRLVKG